MPQIGPAEMLMVAVIALIIFGPQRLPEIARTVGKAIAEFKRQATDLRSEFESGLNDDELPEDEKPAPPEVVAPTPGAPAAEADTVPTDPTDG
jgi:sec-independent protein translocase protein TatA